MIGKAHGWGTFPKSEARFGCHLVLGPLFGLYPPSNFVTATAESLYPDWGHNSSALASASALSLSLFIFIFTLILPHLFPALLCFQSACVHHGSDQYTCLV